MHRVCVDNINFVNNVELRFVGEKFPEIRTSSIVHHLCYKCKLYFAYSFFKFVHIIICIIILLLWSSLSEKFISMVLMKKISYSKSTKYTDRTSTLVLQPD